MIDIKKVRAELAREFSQHKYDVQDDGRILFSRPRIVLGGVFTHRVNGADERVDHNLMLNAGLDNILGVVFKGVAQAANYYIAPFSSNNNIDPNLVAADFNAALTEFTTYSEGARPGWVSGAVASQSVGNGASPARFTISTIGNVYGAALATVSTKNPSVNHGLLVCCSKFAYPRTNLQVGDKLDIEYTFSASDAP